MKYLFNYIHLKFKKEPGADTKGTSLLTKQYFEKILKKFYSVVPVWFNNPSTSIFSNIIILFFRLFGVCVQTVCRPCPTCTGWPKKKVKFLKIWYPCSHWNGNPLKYTSIWKRIVFLYTPPGTIDLNNNNSILPDTTYIVCAWSKANTFLVISNKNTSITIKIPEGAC